MADSDVVSDELSTNEDEERASGMENDASIYPDAKVVKARAVAT